MDVKRLHKDVIDNIEGIMREAEIQDISVTELLNNMCPTENSNIVNILLEMEGILVDRYNNNLGTPLNKILTHGKSYRIVLLKCYLDSVYDSCFYSSDTSVGLYDVVSYIKYVDNITADFDMAVDHFQQEVPEGAAVHIERLVPSDTLTLIRNLAIGTEYTYEFVRRVDPYIFEIADKVKQIGELHNALLLSKFIHILKDDAEFNLLKLNDDFQINNVKGIDINDYFSINQKFDNVSPDTIIGDNDATLRYFVTHSIALELRDQIKYISDKKYNTLFGNDKDILTLNKSLIEQNDLDGKFIIYNKDKSVILIKVKQPVMEHEKLYNFKHSMLIRQYFGMYYALVKADGAKSFMYHVS